MSEAIHEDLRDKGLRKSMNVIEMENRREGTNEWRLQNPPDIKGQYPPGAIDRSDNRCKKIEGYAWPASVNIGDEISFFVSTSSAAYSIKIFRMGYYGGKGGRDMGVEWTGLTVGANSDLQPEPVIGSGDASNWKPAHLNGSNRFRIPPEWVSGCYVAKLQEAGGTQSYIFFVVRDDYRDSDLLMQCSTATYHAYNGWGGDSVYSYNNLDGKWRNDGTDIWLKRPYLPSSCPAGKFGAGAGAFFTHDKGPGGASTWQPERPDASGVYSSSGWEYNMVRWLEREGYDVTYCDSFDTHENQLARARHRAFLSVGHDEYWSLQAYNNVVNARDQRGTSLLWFSGNTVWNCIDVHHEGKMRVVGNYQPGNGLAVTDYGLTGGTWTYGGETDFAIAPSCPTWMTNGVTLRPNNILGNRMLGYEGNGVCGDHPEWNAFLPTGMQTILTGDKAQGIWYTSKRSGATVVSVGTVQWSWGLDDFTVEDPPVGRGTREDAGVRRFTKNVIDHCLDAKHMVADLADGIYEVQSAAAFPQNLIVKDNGKPNGPVVIYGDGKWRSSNAQAKWIIKQYRGSKNLPKVVGPYKGAPDVWYTIRNAENGQSLIVSENGIENGPVIVIGDRNGSWGQGPDNTQLLWRIWRYTKIHGSQPAYILQNVCNGQLLIVGDSGRRDGAVMVYGRGNSGWGEQEDNPQKLWLFKAVGGDDIAG